jgi:group I intron endonuclease
MQGGKFHYGIIIVNYYLVIISLDKQNLELFSLLKLVDSKGNNFYNVLLLSNSVLLNKVENFKPVKYYNNFKKERIQILKDLKDQSGVYLLLNLTNSHFYIGSSSNLSNRMRNYLNTSFLKNNKNNNMPIIQAILKYGHENFALLILELLSFKDLSLRETYYITKFLPYYNVLKQGYSSLGYKHTEETIIMLTKLAKNRKHSLETKSLISRALVGENNPFYNKSHSIENKLRIIEAKSAYPLYIYNSFRELLVIFPSVKTFSKLIHSNHSTIVSFLNKEELFRGE